MLTKREVCNFE